MNFKLRYIITPAIIVVCCTGCINVNKQIDTAEWLLEEQPDSAMLLLNSITAEDIFFDNDKARYALLYTKAQDKNYIDETSDSLIRIAVDYYNNNGTPSQLFMSLYYWGRIQYNAGNDYIALATYAEAEQLISQVKDDYTIGLLYSQIGEIYFKNYDYYKSLSAFKKAYYHYDKANLLKHRNFALIDQGYSYLGICNADSCDILLNKALKNALERKDSIQVSAASVALLAKHIEYKETQKATEIYNKYQNYNLFLYAKPSFYTDMALLHAYNNDTALYNKYMLEARNRSQTTTDSVYLYLAEAKYFEYKKNFATAYKKLNRKVDLENSLALKALAQPVLTAQRDFLSSELELKKRDHQRACTLYIVSTLLFIAISTIVFILLYRRNRRNREQLKEYIDIVAELRETIQLRTIESGLIQELFSEKYSIINNLGGLFADFEDTKQLEKQIVHEVKVLIKKFSTNKTITELELLVDKYCNNAMTLLHQEMPDFSDIEYRQVCYHYAGFSVKLIGFFMQENTANIYKRRNRIKGKISVNTPPHKDLFLSLFR